MISAYAYESRGKKRGNTIFINYVDRLYIRVGAIQCGSHTPANSISHSRYTQSMPVIILAG